MFGNEQEAAEEAENSAPVQARPRLSLSLRLCTVALLR